MDIYEEKMPAEEPEPRLLSSSSSTAATASSGSTLHTTIPPPPRTAVPTTSETASPPQPQSPSSSSPSSTDPSPAHLNRLAARDRAYMLLHTLTKLGPGASGGQSGVENPEAWLVLARSHELSGQLGRAKKALWWVVRLEEGRGIRGWNSVRGG